MTYPFDTTGYFDTTGFNDSTGEVIIDLEDDLCYQVHRILAPYLLLASSTANHYIEESYLLEIESQMITLIQDIIYSSYIDLIDVKVAVTYFWDNAGRFHFTITIPRGVYPSYEGLQCVIKDLDCIIDAKIDENISESPGGGPELI